MTENEAIRLIVADDHPVVLGGIERFFADVADVAIVGTARSFAELVQTIDQQTPDVAVVDLNMDGMRGASGLQELMQRQVLPRLVVFTMQDEDGYALSLLQSGVAAYLSKNRSPSELLQAVRTAHQGGQYLTTTLAAKLLSDGQQANTRGHQALSAREQEVFFELVKGRSARQISNKLGVSVSTIHTYTERIKLKLGVDSLQELVSYAFRHDLAG